MIERPIIFSGPMVRAILDGRKTQTRRVVKDAHGAFWDHASYEPIVDRGAVVDWRCDDGRVIGVGSPRRSCPYGVAGDRLWVRETWSPIPLGSYREGSRFAGRFAWYAADIDRPTWGGKWRSPIHMPRNIARLALEVVRVRVERLHEISKADAVAEGFEDEVGGHPRLPGCVPLEHFRAAWESINAKRGYSWDANPWVWVIEFNRVIEVDGGASSRPRGRTVKERSR